MQDRVVRDGGGMGEEGCGRLRSRVVCRQAALSASHRAAGCDTRWRLLAEGR